MFGRCVSGFQAVAPLAPSVRRPSLNLYTGSTWSRPLPMGSRYLKRRR